MKNLKPMNIFFLLLMPVLAYGLYVIAVLTFGTLNDYQPEEKIDIASENETDALARDSAILSLMTVSYTHLTLPTRLSV